MLVGLFGSLPFAVAEGAVLTFGGFSRSLGENWAFHDVIGGKPVPEWTGSNGVKVSFSMRFDSSLGVPPQTGMQMLKSMMESRSSHSLVIGTEYFGRFIIESLEEERAHFDGAGFALVGSVRVSLAEDPR